eukprot:CAMPEP_0119552164 /NCGR_PEP_ID=MMETSP1352-20130426/5233_1 /TAXON_ID=265584 /ORGANISM="Stauroneis constricta, Strain CCMP1120" /LENGTH=327 /DNA_ID=CAMNT_0007598355 /DNA_START=51 /DNA_END=1035 /DNA_ORIENTATION=-
MPQRCNMKSSSQLHEDHVADLLSSPGSSSSSSSHSQTSSSTSTSASRPRRSVRFRTVPLCRDTLSRSDITDAEKRAAWYTHREIRGMIPDAKTMKQLQKCCSSDSCIRGLEYHTKKGSKERQKAWLLAGLALMDEQDLQRKDEEYDDEALADIYQDRTWFHQQGAHLIGLIDEAYVRMHVCRQSPEDIQIPVFDKRVVRECEKLKSMCSCHLDESLSSSSTHSSKSSTSSSSSSARNNKRGKGALKMFRGLGFGRSSDTTTTTTTISNNHNKAMVAATVDDETSGCIGMGRLLPSTPIESIATQRNASRVDTKGSPSMLQDKTRMYN